MIGRAAASLTLLAIAGCGVFRSAGDPATERCRQLAYQDPAVAEQVQRGTATGPQVRVPALLEQDNLVRRDVQKCLAGQGLAPRGGVEAVKPP